MAHIDRLDQFSEAETEKIAHSKASLENFNDIDAAAIIRDLNMSDDDGVDLEKQIDYDMNDDKDDRFKNELLFCVQGLGSIKQHGQLEFYMKGPHCEDSLKDLIRFCKRDDDDNPVCKYELGKWGVFQNDLVHLLVTQTQDKKLTFYLMILLVLLTEYPKKGSARHNEIIEILQNYKTTFTINENIIQAINLHLADCLSVEESSRLKSHDHMIELIITLYRNLLKVPDADKNEYSERFKKNLHLRFVETLHKQNSLDAFVFLVQQSSATMMKKMSLTLLEIFFSILIPFEAKWLFKNPHEDKSQLQIYKEKEERERVIRLGEMSSRHARFECNVKVTRKIGGGFKVIHNPFKSVHPDVFPQQIARPKKRKIEERNLTIFPKNYNQELLVLNALAKDELEESMKKIIRDYALDFIEHAYDKLMEELADEMEKDSERIEEQDQIHYVMIMAYGLEVARYSYHYFKDLRTRNPQAAGNRGEDFDIASVGAALQLSVYEFLQKIIMKEITKKQKKIFSIRLFHAGFHCFLQLLYCVKEMRLAFNNVTRKNAQILMQKIFTADNSRLLKMGFNNYNKEVHDMKVGKTLIEFLGVFYDLLEDYSKGKVLKIHTEHRAIKNKVKEKKEKAKKEKKEKAKKELAKPKPNANPENPENPQNLENPDGTLESTLERPASTLEPTVGEGDTFERIEKLLEAEQRLENAGNLENEEVVEEDEEDDEDSEDEDDNAPLYRERIVSFASELAFLADYRVLEIVLDAIRADKLETNDPAVNSSVAKFMKKVVTTLNADWLFFQIDYLLIFQEILNVKNPKILIENQLLFETIRGIVKSFFKHLKTNSMLSVEALFRFSDRKTKDDIINNYEGQTDIQMAMEDPLGDLLDNNDDFNRGELGPKFTEKIDLILIQNYDDYKNYDDCEMQLCLLLNKMGLTDYSESDIRQRLKMLGLHKGKQKALEIFNQIYKDEMNITLEHALRQAFSLLDPAKFSKLSLKLFLIGVLKRFLDYKIEMGNEMGSLSAVDMAIIPLNVMEFDILDWDSLPLLFQSMHFRPPCQGEIHWRIPGFLAENEIEELIKKIETYFEDETLLETTIKTKIDKQREETELAKIQIEKERAKPKKEHAKPKTTKIHKTIAGHDAEEGEMMLEGGEAEYQGENEEKPQKAKKQRLRKAKHSDDEEEEEPVTSQETQKRNKRKKAQKKGPERSRSPAAEDAGDDEYFVWYEDSIEVEKPAEDDKDSDEEGARKKKKHKEEKKKKKKDKKSKKDKKDKLKRFEATLSGQEENNQEEGTSEVENSYRPADSQTPERENDDEEAHFGEDSESQHSKKDKNKLKENKKEKTNHKTSSHTESEEDKSDTTARRKSRMKKVLEASQADEPRFPNTIDEEDSAIDIPSPKSIPESGDKPSEAGEQIEEIHSPGSGKNFSEDLELQRKPIEDLLSPSSIHEDKLQGQKSPEFNRQNSETVVKTGSLKVEKEVHTLENNEVEVKIEEERPLQRMGSVKIESSLEREEVITVEEVRSHELGRKNTGGSEIEVKEEYVKVEDDGRPKPEITLVSTLEQNDEVQHQRRSNKKVKTNTFQSTATFPTIDEGPELLEVPRKSPKENSNSQSVQMFLNSYDNIETHERFIGSNSQSNNEESFILKFYNKQQGKDTGKMLLEESPKKDKKNDVISPNKKKDDKAITPTFGEDSDSSFFE